MMQVAEYLDRIAYSGSTAPTWETLRELHRAHLMAVPFENLDIHLEVPIELSVPAFYDKIVHRLRGGFCYELNGLFAWLLEQLGYRVSLLSARVASAGSLSPEFDHLTLLVESDAQWIADVGFGEWSMEPLVMERFDDQQNGGGYSLIEEAGSWTVRKPIEGGWEPQYVFSLTPHSLEEFEARCRFHQTSPESHFTRKPVCSIATPDGRITLSGHRVIVSSGGRREEREVEGAEAYRSVLSKEFGVDLTRRDIDRLAATP